YSSYERFTRLSQERWRDQPRGKFFGRLFFRFAGKRLRQNSDRAIRYCDLLNLPNEEEITSLRLPRAPQKPVVVQPYGLTDEDRTAFAGAMQSPETRFKAKEICFVGMWGLRKGSRDWPEIIRRIRQTMPDAR